MPSVVEWMTNDTSTAGATCVSVNGFSGDSVFSLATTSPVSVGWDPTDAISGSWQLPTEVLDRLMMVIQSPEAPPAKTSWGDHLHSKDGVVEIEAVGTTEVVVKVTESTGTVAPARESGAELELAAGAPSMPMSLLLTSSAAIEHPIKPSETIVVSSRDLRCLAPIKGYLLF
jgi:hypothetical protein